MTTQDTARAALITAFTRKMARERELLITEADLSPAEIDAEIDAAMRRFYLWLPAELERLQRELN